MAVRAHPLIKLCGLQTISHLRTAEALEADYVGLVVEVAGSPRSLSPAQARVMTRAARVPCVLVTNVADAAEVARLAEAVRPAIVQLHGGGGSDVVAQLRSHAPNIAAWYVVSVHVEAAASEVGRFVAEAEAALAAGAQALLIDAVRAGRSGGQGLAANWDLAADIVRAVPDRPVFLAGGLTPANVAEAVRRVRPAGVDVSSGIESARGLKSTRLMAEFVRNVRFITDGDGRPQNRG